MERGKLSVKDLEKLVDEGEIDTVLCMFTDLQGRFMGKRTARSEFSSLWKTVRRQYASM